MDVWEEVVGFQYVGELVCYYGRLRSTTVMNSRQGSKYVLSRKMAQNRRSRWGISMLEPFLDTTFLMLSGPGAFMGLNLLRECSSCSAMISEGLWTGSG